MVDPQDQRSRSGILGREYRMEEGDLAGNEGEEIRSPVGVEDGVSWEGRRQHRGRRMAREGGSKVVAVIPVRHCNPRVEVDKDGGVGESRVVVGRGD